MKYKTIVADPPWRYKSSLPEFGQARGSDRSAVPYATLSIGEIAVLPVSELADAQAHLYLWTTNTHLEHAWSIIRAWGFKFSTMLVWCKPPRGGAGFPTFGICTEFVLFCYRGKCDALKRLDRNWWEWSRSAHSGKPEAFIDMVEQVSPGPYLEMFARRNRLGWHTWGNECLNHVELAVV